MIGAIRAALSAIRAYYNPTVGSAPISFYPPQRHLEIERREPFRKYVGGRWMMEIPPISVDAADKIAVMQFTIRGALKAVMAAIADRPEALVRAAEVRRQYLEALIFLLYDLSKDRYSILPERRAYLKHLRKYFREDPMEAVKTFDQLLERNALLESFFFEIATVNRRKVQRPDRDGWRAIRSRVWREEWGNLLEAPILKVHSIILADLEEEQLAEMEREQRKLEEELAKLNNG